MSRRENPIGQCGKSLHALAAWLRAGREAAGLTYEQLAARTEFSADTLSRAASGRNVPKNLSVVLAYADACDLPEKDAEKLWKTARRDEARAQGVLSGNHSGVHISIAKDFADLHSAIVDLYQEGGSPPLRSLDARLGGVGLLPHSTVGRVLKGRSTPSRQFVLAFAEALGARRSDLAEWGKVWDRADRDRRSTRHRFRTQVREGLDDRLTTHNRVTPRDLQLLMSDLESSARREPGLRLMVHIPDNDDAEAHNTARMTRELLVDQAQRSGALACPRCGRPSFGYNDTTGWSRALCENCRPPTTSPSGQSPQPDTPTLSLRPPRPTERTPLPRRHGPRTWPRPQDQDPIPPLTPATLLTISDQPPAPTDLLIPPATETTSGTPAITPAPPTKPGTAPHSLCYPQYPSPHERPDAPEPATERAKTEPPTPLAIRIRINIPGSRPAPPTTTSPETFLETTDWFKPRDAVPPSYPTAPEDSDTKPL
ncbi:helix-turn-helix transcriptional regulator [Streptomyces sp. MUSC 14]|uniref:helix-turn-helix domain-containing protein n=1 Tax=Streptomyces sp. MUSC 14 TaxID=1354889 RepID=UPI000AFC42CF|nr:helix-turn-helix transcriptional regulator [Streptomyces sp. MUSC 14]